MSIFLFKQTTRELKKYIDSLNSLWYVGVKSKYHKTQFNI